MDQALIAAAAVFFGLVAILLWANSYLGSRKAKRETHEVGYRRPEIHIDANAVPEFKPSWRDMRGKNEAR
jgi:hypothetical protein